MEKIIDNLISKDNLFKTLENRFNKNIYRHPNIKWDEIASLLENDSEKISSLSYLETSGENLMLLRSITRLFLLIFVKNLLKNAEACATTNLLVLIEKNSHLFLVLMKFVSNGKWIY